YATVLVIIHGIRRFGYKSTEGMVVLFETLGGFGILLWLFWNLIIFKDPLYFIFGPYAAATQQAQLAAAGVLATKHNLLFSLKTYIYAVIYNAGMLPTILACISMPFFWFDKKINSSLRLASTA